MWAALIPLIVQIVGFVLERVGASIEAKKNFLRMVGSLSNEGLVSVQLHRSYEEQIARLSSEP